MNHGESSMWVTNGYPKWKPFKLKMLNLRSGDMILARSTVFGRPPQVKSFSLRRAGISRGARLAARAGSGRVDVNRCKDTFDKPTDQPKAGCYSSVYIVV